MKTLRSFLICCTITLLSTTVAQAQTTMTIKSQYGQAWQQQPPLSLRSSDKELNIPHYSFNVEVFKPINDHFAIGAAPGFSRRGTEFEFGFLNGFFVGASFRARLFLNYLELPFLAKIETNIFRKLTVHGQFGAGLSYLAGGYREATTIGSEATTTTQDLDFEFSDAELSRIDFGGYGSLGLGYPIGNGQIILSGNYYYGFVDVDQKNESLNRNWGVGLGYQFPLSKANDED